MLRSKVSAEPTTEVEHLCQVQHTPPLRREAATLAAISPSQSDQEVPLVSLLVIFGRWKTIFCKFALRSTCRLIAVQLTRVNRGGGCRKHARTNIRSAATALAVLPTSDHLCIKWQECVLIT